jgi:hypothetical protein
MGSPSTGSLEGIQLMRASFVVACAEHSRIGSPSSKKNQRSERETVYEAFPEQGRWLTMDLGSSAKGQNL